MDGYAVFAEVLLCPFIAANLAVVIKERKLVVKSLVVQQSLYQIDCVMPHAARLWMPHRVLGF